MQSEHGKELLLRFTPFSSSSWARTEHRRRGSTGGACPGGCGYQRRIGRGVVAALAVSGPGSIAVWRWSGRLQPVAAWPRRDRQPRRRGSSGGEEWRKGGATGAERVGERSYGTAASSALFRLRRARTERPREEKAREWGARSFNFLQAWTAGTARMARCRAERASKGHAAHGTMPGRPRHCPIDPNSEIPDCIETPETLP
jgi:hypothetical protein